MPYGFSDAHPEISPARGGTGYGVVAGGADRRADERAGEAGAAKVLVADDRTSGRARCAM